MPYCYCCNIDVPSEQQACMFGAPFNCHLREEAEMKGIDGQITVRNTLPKPGKKASSRARREIDRLRAALTPFAFAPYPDKFKSDDGGCTEVIVGDADVQEARRVLEKGT